MRKTKFRITFNDGETRTAELSPPKKCYCNRNITPSELENIVKKLRQKQVITENRTQYLNGNKLYINDKGEKFFKLKNNKGFGYYKIDSQGKKNPKPESKDKIKTIKPFTKKYSKYDEDGTTIFSYNRPEKISKSEANYTTFAKYLNLIFDRYDINTCLQKMHFLAQSYAETFNFQATYENVSGEGYFGGSHYQGRGLIHLTHDSNYLKYYDEAIKLGFINDYKIIPNKNCYVVERNENQKEIIVDNQYSKLFINNLPGESVKHFIKRVKNSGFPENFEKNKLSPFVVKVSTELKHACYSAGFFWKDKNINNAFIDKNGKPNSSSIYSYKVTSKVNPKDTNSEKKKENFESLKEIFDYENTCINR